MRKRITLVTVMVLLGGFLVTALPGTALQIGDGSEQPPAPQGMSTGILQEDDSALVRPFLQALADKLGISVDQLREAIQAAKEEVIQQRLGEAVRAGRLTQEQARGLQERLSRAEPRDLLRFMLERFKSREGPERLGQQRMPFGKELKRGRLLGPRWQPPRSYMPPYQSPYYQPYSYNCVCYCNLPAWYFAPTPMQPQPMMPQFWKFQQAKPQLKDQAPKGP
jgi:hypothetical protein